VARSVRAGQVGSLGSRLYLTVDCARNIRLRLMWEGLREGAWSRRSSRTPKTQGRRDFSAARIDNLESRLR
jgi:hypothetical protein